MFRVVSCLAYEHDYSFVLVALIVCIAGCAMTVQLFQRARRLSGNERARWIVLSGAAGGMAVWTTHFVSMAGFNPPLAYAYEPILTLGSLVLAVGFTMAGLKVATAGGTAWAPEVGGLIVGVGIASMHFTGMAGLSVAGRVEWDADLVAASILLGLAFAVIATNRITRGSTVLGIAALVFAIAGMHFTAMGAAVFFPDPSVTLSSGAFSSEAIAISVVALLSVLTGLVLYVVDARSQREMMSSLRHAALHDPLTGMPNRAYLSTELPAMLHDSARSQKRTAVIVMDLDRFKDINDVHGHRAGDALLKGVAEQLRQAIRPGEFVARVGGDEFVAVKRELASMEEALDYARRLAAAACLPVAFEGLSLSVGSSIGISLSPDDAGREDDLISTADLAMYRAKRQASQKICFFDRALDEGGRKQSALAMDLRHALARNQLELYYQPQIDVESGETAGYEALLRWNHPERGIVSPLEFIPIAEATGLILPIGEWVLRTAWAEVATWERPCRLSVNIAAAQLTQTDLPAIVHTVLLETGLPPSRLELEITEASIIEDSRHTLQTVRRLKGLGVSIAMDDYGTGYSSLSTLQLFPFDKIKIDRSFIEGLTTNQASAAIVRATILLAESLQIPVLAEGVEHKEHFDFLRAEGCAEVQGFLFGRPQPLGEIAPVVGRRAVVMTSVADVLPARAVALYR